MARVSKKGKNVASKSPKDARNKIIAKSRSKMSDARDKLVKLNHASGVDARAKITKIRNLKKGMLDVKTTSGGAITITKTTQGKTLLTTKKKTAKADTRAKKTSKNVTKTVGRGGALSLKTRGKTDATIVGVAKAKPKQRAEQRPRRLTRTIKGQMSAAAKLDMELMNTHVKPIILKRTVNQDIDRQRYRRRSPSPREFPRFRRRSPSPLNFRMMQRMDRSRSPIDVDMYDSNRRRNNYHFDDPRREAEREESFARRLQMQQEPPVSHRTMADRVADNFVSPLEGAKVVVTNLQISVTKEDIIELFGDVGALKRAKVSTPGSAEVVFVNRADALKAVEIYHNRQLDGKAMKCLLVGSGGLEPSAPNSSYRLPGANSRENRRPDSRGAGQPVPPIEVNSIHRALFNDRKSRSSGYQDHRDNRSRRF